MSDYIFSVDLLCFRGPLHETFFIYNWPTSYMQLASMCSSTGILQYSQIWNPWICLQYLRSPVAPHLHPITFVYYIFSCLSTCRLPIPSCLSPTSPLPLSSLPLGGPCALPSGEEQVHPLCKHSASPHWASTTSGTYRCVFQPTPSQYCDPMLSPQDWALNQNFLKCGRLQPPISGCNPMPSLSCSGLFYQPLTSALLQIVAILEGGPRGFFQVVPGQSPTLQASEGLRIACRSL